MKKNLWQRYIDYIKDNPEHYWFKRKILGWGWTPVTIEGWLVTFIFLILILFLAFNLNKDATDSEVFLTFVLPVFVLVVLLMGIARKKGEKPRWQWGFKDAEEKQEDFKSKDSHNEQDEHHT